MSVPPKQPSLRARAYRRHHGRDEPYDPAEAKKSPVTIVLAVVSVLVLAGAGIFFYTMMANLEAEERARRERPEASRRLLADLKSFRASNRGDDRIDVVRRYVEERKDKLEDTEKFEAERMLVELGEQKKQADFQAKLNRILNEVRRDQDKPELVDSVKRKVQELRAILMDLDDDRAAEVKKEIFVALGKSAIAAAKGAMAKADAYAAEHPNDYLESTVRYEKVDDELSAVDEAARLPETKELKSDLTRRMDAIAEKWNDATRGFEAVPAKNLLDPKEFAPRQGEEKAPWQTSPGAKIGLFGSKLVLEGVAPERPVQKDERAGIAFWSPGPKTAIRHYELRARVKIVKGGFTLVARQSQGYLRHTFGFEAKGAGSGAVTNVTFVPDEGTTYEITERVFGRKVKIEIFSTKEDDAAIAPVEDSTNAREGGVGLQIGRGSMVEFERLEIRILR